MGRATTTAVVLTAVAVAAAGCRGAAPPEVAAPDDGGVVRTVGATSWEEREVACYGASVPLATFLDPPPFDPDSSLAAVWDEVLADAVDHGAVGVMTGVRDDFGVLYEGEAFAVVTHPDPIDDELGPVERRSVWRLERRTDIDGWRMGGSGGCDAVVSSTEGFENVPWEPRGPLDPATTTVEVVVHEIACSGGSSAEGRVRTPEVHLTATAVEVTFSVAPVEGSATCPGNPDTPVTLELPEPLGDRELLDGRTRPALPPVLGDR